MMIHKVENRYSSLNMLNGNLTIGLTDKMQNCDVEYYLQASALKSGVCDWGVGDYCSEGDIVVKTCCQDNFLINLKSCANNNKKYFEKIIGNNSIRYKNKIMMQYYIISKRNNFGIMYVRTGYPSILTNLW